MLMNIGFNEAQLQEEFHCFIFHDVDFLPEDDGNPYTCPQEGKPRQMSFSIDYWDNYKYVVYCTRYTQCFCCYSIPQISLPDFVCFFIDRHLPAISEELLLFLQMISEKSMAFPILFGAGVAKMISYINVYGSIS